MRTTTRTICRGLALWLASCAIASAASVTIEPDKFLLGGDLSNVGPGATLSTYRTDGMGGYYYEPVYAIAGGPWSPTGSRVFGHLTHKPSETAHHWDDLTFAYLCMTFGGVDCLVPAYLLRVDFASPTTTVEILTTMRGEQAMDPIELVAFNSSNQRILRCRVHPVVPSVLQTGVLPEPTYYDPANPGGGKRCGVVISKKNCSGSQPGNCDYVVSARVVRRQQDIAYVWFGGLLSDNTWAPADSLTYSY